jgi:hypothetical protein
VNEYLPFASVTVVATCVTPPTSWMSWIVCPDLQAARGEFSLPEIVMAVPGATAPPGFPWIERVVRDTDEAATAIPPDRTKERQINNRDAKISFRLAPFIQPPPAALGKPTSRYTRTERQATS